MAADLCFPLLKYSHAVGMSPDNTIPWNHLQASDLFVIVTGKNTHLVDGLLTLRVVQGNRVLESIDVASYVDASRAARRGAEQHGVTPQLEQLPIFGMTKEALLALRYRPADGQTRRLQLRVESATQCLQIVNAFKARGMEFQAQRPGTGRQNTARPISAMNTERLLTATSSSPHFQSSQAGPYPSPTRNATSEIGSLPRLPTARPVETQTFAARSAEYCPGAQSQAMPPPRFLVRDEAAAPREVVPSRPSTSQLYRSYTTPSQPLSHEVQEWQRRPLDLIEERPSSTSHMATLASIREAVEAEASPPRTANGMPLSVFHPTLPVRDPSCSTPEPGALIGLSSDARPHTARPSTSATSIPPEMAFDHDIPPPRELPFKQPDSRRAGSAHSGSRPGTSAMSLPPLPKPKLREEGSSSSTARADLLSPEKGLSSSRPGTASPLKRGFNAVDANTEAQRAQTSMGLGAAQQGSTHGDTSPSKKTRVTELTAAAVISPRKPSGMKELLSRRPLEECSVNARMPRMDSLADAPHETVSPPPKRAAARDSTASVYKLAAESSITGTATGEVSIGEYATQSRQEREEVLEQFMMEHLEDPAFATLCEDVENCWRLRVVLGL
ncbi:hypothetical protein LTR02_001679 [Friedmanniomyces endolithicus]|nr:hypothetical protein LTR94_002525 [Friedmanniomyces endolithicus]KAK0801401.1 hypothetical protein LTR59_005434 [Friedmanniomyces endolithicus]KAK0807159.1 hypothetical protein LTR38_004989 [Friedmanniomyces endolithicus]KAK0821164.1 hypothetical protein LTR75_000965 [Friedmanniomyces endolithicus]KAK0851815.1 hypothetical protein LTR03_003839 [Friedmanniomyces endolithicus]